jgi:hypothetical protein
VNWIIFLLVIIIIALASIGIGLNRIEDKIKLLQEFIEDKFTGDVSDDDEE